MALWELPELGENMGVFWWWNHQNTPIYPLFHGDSQRPKTIRLILGIKTRDQDPQEVFLPSSLIQFQK